MRLALHYCKYGSLKYLSHLDVQRLWQRMFHIAGLEPEQTQGFNPHPKLRFALPLATGYYSQAEVLEIYLVNQLPPQEAAKRLNRFLPRGMEVLNAAVLDSSVPKLTALVTGVGYRLEFNRAVDDIFQQVEEKPVMLVNEKQINLPTNILGIKVQAKFVNLAVKVEEQRAVRPEGLMKHLFGAQIVKTITRQHLFAEQAGFLPPGISAFSDHGDYVDDNS
jgi:radical SAM-linked protein